MINTFHWGNEILVDYIVKVIEIDVDYWWIEVEGTVRKI